MKMTNRIIFPDEAVKIASVLAEKGYKAYAVGGCVRDSVMGRVPSDWDMTTDARPEDMLDIFKAAELHTIPTGLKHGTVTVMIDHKPFEITTFRIDGEYTDSRRPDSVTFSSDISEDLKRRDFTVNAMAADPLSSSGEIVDLFGGLCDIENKIIRCVGDPFERFSEDALRILRAVRFSSVLGFEIDRETLIASARLSHKLADISAERKAVELEKILLSANADKGFMTLCERDAAKYIHRHFHAPCVPLSSLPKNFSSRLAAIIEGNERISLAEMKLSNEVTRRAVLLADQAFYNATCHFFGEDIGANARYMIAKYKNDAEAAAILRRDDDILSAIDRERAKGGFPTEIRELKIDGNMLMAAKIPQRMLGEILSKLLLAAIKEPSVNTIEALTDMARDIAAKEDK